MILECFRNRKQRETRGESLTRHYVPASRATILDRARVKGGWSELQEGGLSRSSPPFIFSSCPLYWLTHGTCCPRPLANLPLPACHEARATVACSPSAMARKVAAVMERALLPVAAGRHCHKRALLPVLTLQARDRR
jgi:hypothetical protein